MDIWRNSTICYKSEGEPVLIHQGSGAYTTRPMPPTCPSGYTLCGSSSSNVAYKICSSTTTCPITALKSFSSTSATDYVNGDAGGAWDGYYSVADGTILAYRRAGIDELPLVAPASHSGTTADNFYTTLASSSTEVPCYGTSDPRTEYTTASSGSTGSNGVNNYATESCSRDDSRYIQVDTQTETEALTQNLLSTAHSPCATTTTTQFGFASGNCTSSNSYCCDSSDSVCTTVVERTTCSKIAQYASGSNSVLFLQRPQIFWDSTCMGESDATQSQVSTVSDPVSTLLGAQQANLWVNIFTTLICTWIIPCCLLYNAWGGNLPCVSGDGEEEAYTVQCYAKVPDGILFIAKITCCVIAFVMSALNKNAFDAWASCSDSVTDYTLVGLGTTMQTVYSNNLTNFVVDFLTCLYKIYGCCTLKATKVYRDLGEYERAQEETAEKPSVNLDEHASDGAWGGNAGQA